MGPTLMFPRPPLLILASKKKGPPRLSSGLG
jgi:hypothetical protein